MLTKGARLTKTFRAVYVTQVAGYKPVDPSKMPRSPLEKSVLTWENSFRATGKASFDRRKRYQPEFWQACEMFIDHSTKMVFPKKAPPGFVVDWNCVKDQGPVHHWSQSADENGVTRVVMETPTSYPCHFEIHWDHWFLLAYQHDPVVREVKPEGSIKDILLRKKEGGIIEHLVRQNNPDSHFLLDGLMKMPKLSELNETINYSFHYGIDIPLTWMMVFKKVKWPKSYEPTYMKDVNYFDAFRDTRSMDAFRKSSYFNGVPEEHTDASHIRAIETHLRRTEPHKYGGFRLRKDQEEELFEEGHFLIRR